MANHFYPTAMTIAGSDSGGGAGVQVDLRTFAAFRVFGTSAVTAVTFQNPLEVTGIESVSPEAVYNQITTVRKAIQVQAVKTGMLFSKEIIEAVTEAMQDFTGPRVVDPVMISTSGKKLLKDDAVNAVKEILLPHATWITPNIPEARVLTGRVIETPEQAIDAAKACADRWGCSVIIKGGHSEGNEAADIAVHNGKVYRLSAPRVPVIRNADHGTGCTFSAALTALFAQGTPYDEALIRAKAFVLGSLSETVRIGDNELFGMYPPTQKKYETMIRYEEICQ